MRWLLVSFVLGCVGLEARTILYDRKQIPQGWHLISRASRFQTMDILIAVKQQNLQLLEDRFWAVSDPSSRDWRKFMTVEDIGAIVKSSEADMQIVLDWVTSSTAKSSVIKQSADAVRVQARVADIEKLFDAEVYLFSHANGHTIKRVMGPHSVPHAVGHAIDFVEGVADFPMHRSSARKVAHNTFNQSSQEGLRSALVCPETLKSMYAVPATRWASRISQGPAEFQDDTSYNKGDLKTFFNKGTHERAEAVSEIVGPYDGSAPDTETTLDVQYIMTVGHNQVDWYWTSKSWMYTFAHNFFNHDSVPDAVSISWGWAEDQQCSAGIDQGECQTLGIDSSRFVARVNTEFQKIGLRGVSIFVASGDSGANGRSDPMCTDRRLHASFPGSSPYVTTVGATMLQDPKFDLKNAPSACSSQGPAYACASGGTEVAVSAGEAGFTSGGGFSTYVAMPSYQKEAVTAYLKSGVQLPPKEYFNSSHRGYPDIAAMGNNFLIYMNSMGGWQPVGGTSAATPTVAGVAAHLNDLSYKRTGKPLGFLNPLLYKMHAEMPDAFTDVLVGDNKCTESGCFASCKGYEATKGWDPVTGLGTPVADKMLAYLEKLFRTDSVLHV